MLAYFCHSFHSYIWRKCVDELYLWKKNVTKEFSFLGNLPSPRKRVWQTRTDDRFLTRVQKAHFPAWFQSNNTLSLHNVIHTSFFVTFPSDKHHSNDHLNSSCARYSSLKQTETQYLQTHSHKDLKKILLQVRCFRNIFELGQKKVRTLRCLVTESIFFQSFICFERNMMTTVCKMLNRLACHVTIMQHVPCLLKSFETLSPRQRF